MNFFRYVTEEVTREPKNMICHLPHDKHDTILGHWITCHRIYYFSKSTEKVTKQPYEKVVKFAFYLMKWMNCRIQLCYFLL